MGIRLLVMALALAGCATVGRDIDFAAIDAIQTGTPMTEVVARLGSPTGRTRLADGTTQLVWSYGKSNAFGSTIGKAAVLIFDAQGRYTGVASANETNVR